jgi:toxin ParE1/3/4
MKRYRVVYGPDARADLLQVRDRVYSRSLSEVTAARFTDRLVAACDRIGERPLAGRSREDLFPGLRTFAFERKAVIAYLVHDGTVEITNVFYGGRDFEAFYLDNQA